MAPPTPLRYYGLPSGLSNGSGPRLQLVTPSQQIREVPLDRADLMRILSGAVKALEQLDREEARAEAMHEADLADELTACGLKRREVPWSSVTTRTTCPACIGARE